MMKKTTSVKPRGLRYELKFLSGKFENHQFRPVTESSANLRLVCLVGSWGGEAFVGRKSSVDRSGIKCEF